MKLMSMDRLCAASWFGVLVLALLQGCATGPNANPLDPLEPFNRTVFRLNDQVDRALVKPVATVYREFTPKPLRTGETNFSPTWPMPGPPSTTRCNSKVKPPLTA